MSLAFPFARVVDCRYGVIAVWVAIAGLFQGSSVAWADPPSPPLALPRGTVDLRVEYGQQVTDPLVTWTPTQAPLFVNIPRMSATFVAAEDATNLAITFSAEATTSPAGKRMVVRALLDGEPASPAEVTFVEGSFYGARSFIFTGVVARGVHTVEMQWLVDPGATAFLRSAALLLRHGTAENAVGTVTHKTAPGPAGPNQESSWTPVPDMSVWFFNPDGGAEPVVSFSAETAVTIGKRLFVRALIDGVPLLPGDVLFAQKPTQQVHRMSFGNAALGPGWHEASIQWRVDPGGTAQLGDRTILVTSFLQNDHLRHDLVVPPAGLPITTSSSAWSQVPGLSALVPIASNGEVAVTFSGEVAAPLGSILEMRLVANGVAGDETAVLAQEGQVWETQSFTFDRKHVFLPPNTLTGVSLEWRAIGGQVAMDARALELVIEPGLVPDLAEAPPIGRADVGLLEGRLVEAAIGSRPVLTIIHRIQRAPPNHVIPSVAQVTAALYGTPGVADYYDKVSGGRLSMVNAGVLEYDALKSESHYWDHGPYDCAGPHPDGYRGGFTESWAEAILSAADDVDFASFDTDRDHVVEGHELAVLIIKPQALTVGYQRRLDPYCNGEPFEVDGVRLPEIAEWYTSVPTGRWTIAAHELAHLMLGVGDMYDQGVDFDTEAGALSLLGDYGTTTTHFDGPHKLALGWATPYYAEEDGACELDDVKPDGGVVVLPRDQDGDGKEYFVLENRRHVSGSPLYDTGIGEGILVWHVIEDPAEAALPPPCVLPGLWNGVSSNLRRGVRLLRPLIRFGLSSLSFWDAADFDLLDSGLSCPGSPAIVRNALLWADGSASGWGVSDWSAPGPTMEFVIDVP